MQVGLYLLYLLSTWLLFSLFLLAFHLWNSDIFYLKSDINSMGGDPISEMFSLVFDDRKKMPTEMPTSNICFSLYHPKVHVDRASC
jgi:hypothetical protein